VHAACDASLQRLGVDPIDLYYQHRVDPRVAMRNRRRVASCQGRQSASSGLSEASANTSGAPEKVHPITALQSEYSLWTRDLEPAIVPVCENSASASLPTARSAVVF